MSEHLQQEARRCLTTGRVMWFGVVTLLLVATLTGSLFYAAWGLALSAAAATASIRATTMAAIAENRRELELAYKTGRRATLREHDEAA